MDVTTVEDALREYRFLSELAAATQHLVEPAEVMAVTARLVATELEVERCAYAEVEDESVFVTLGDFTRGAPSIGGRWAVAAFGPECVRCMLAGEPYVVQDAERAPDLTDEHRAAFRANMTAAAICVPLHKHGKLTAAMSVQQKEPRAWTRSELQLVTRVVASCWEALERIRVSLTLQASEARYRAMFEASPESALLIAADGTILQANEAAVRTAEGELTGHSVYDYIVPEHRALFASFHQLVCAGKSGTLSFELRSQAGARRSMEANAVPLPHGDGFAQLALARDVSERVQAERALDQSRARLDYAARLSGVGFWYCDLPFDELIWDKNVREHFFLPMETKVTLDLFYERIHPEDREPTREAIERSIGERSSYDVVYRTVEPSVGTIKWVRATGGTTYSAEGTPIRFDGVTLDVTAERRVQEQLTLTLAREREQAVRLVEQDRRRNEFLATLAHELRNPLAPIRTGIQVLRMGASSAQLDRTHEMIGRQLGHMVRMIDDLLDVSRVTRGTIELRKERLELRAVLKSAIETLDLTRHELTMSIPDGELLLDGDLTRLAQVFGNLLNNAIKYTPPTGRIEVIAERMGSRLMIHVRDNGMGIPADMLTDVFDMFTQVDRTLRNAQGGLGIGLALVRSLVELHEGSVVATSEGAGRGSTFTVDLPLAESTKGLRDAARASAPMESVLRILVVDDNEDAAESLEILLQLDGHQTCVAHDGRKAIEAVSAFRPDLVFLDLGLPELNGYEVAERIRADATIRQPFVVALTGWGGDEHKRQTAAAGFDRHMVKPFDTNKLPELLAQAAARAR